MVDLCEVICFLVNMFIVNMYMRVIDIDKFLCKEVFVYNEVFW